METSSGNRSNTYRKVGLNNIKVEELYNAEDTTETIPEQCYEYQSFDPESYPANEYYVEDNNPQNFQEVLDENNIG